MTPEAHDELMETKGLLEAEAPDGAAPDPFEAEEAARGGEGRRQGDGKKGKKKGGKKGKKSK